MAASPHSMKAYLGVGTQLVAPIGRSRVGRTASSDRWRECCRMSEEDR